MTSLNVFLERATQLSAARRLIHEDVEYISAVALLAIHGAISWNDAVLTQLDGKLAKDEDHMAAVRATRKFCSSRRINADGIRHLEKLVAQKSKVSYGDRRTTLEVAQSLSIASQRFEEWAIRTIKASRGESR